MSKVCKSKLNFYLSRTIGHRFWRTLLRLFKLMTLQVIPGIAWVVSVNAWVNRKCSAFFPPDLSF